MTLYEILTSPTFGALNTLKMITFVPAGSKLRETGRVLTQDEYIETNLYTSTDIINGLKRHWGDRQFFTHVKTESEILADFRQCFNEYFAERKMDIGYLAKNLFVVSDDDVFNPIENYDRKEKITDTTTNTDFRVTGSNYATDTNTEGTNDITNKENSYVGNDDVISKVENPTTTNSTVTGDQTTNEQGNATTIYEHTNRTHGNIGVTTTQQMWSSQLEMYRRGALFEMIMLPFIDEYTYY